MDDAWMMDATTMEMTTTTTVVPTTRDEDDGCEGYARDVFVSASPVKYGLDAEWVVSDDDDDDDDDDDARGVDEEENEEKVDVKASPEILRAPKVGVKALSDSEDDDDDSEDDDEDVKANADAAVLRATGGASSFSPMNRAWSAYDPKKEVAKGRDAIVALRRMEDEREREKAEAEEKAKALLNARGRPKRGAAMRTEERSKRAKTKPEEEKRKVHRALEESEHESESDEDGTEPRGYGRRISAPADAGPSGLLEPTSPPSEERPTPTLSAEQAVPSTSDPEDEEEEEETLVQRVLLSSGFSERQREELVKKVLAIGGSVTTSLDDFTVFVTEAPLKRTKNVMAAALRNRPIVGASWLDKSAKQNVVLPPERFLIRDRKFESSHGYNPLVERDQSRFRGLKFTFSNTGATKIRELDGARDVIIDLLRVAGALVSKSDVDADFRVLLTKSKSARTVSRRDSGASIPTHHFGDVLAALLTGRRLIGDGDA
jgi:hypothetical protein